MNKRRRAYKKYDWKAHQNELFIKRFKMAVFLAYSKAIDHAFLYGKPNKMSEHIELTVPSCIVPYLNPKYQRLVDGSHNRLV